jgi:predicted lipase
MLSDYDLVLAAKATYSPSAVPVFEGIGNSIRIFQSKIDGLNTIAVEGTHNPLGWALDFCAMKTEDHEAVNHPNLGFLHAGFYWASLLAMGTIRSLIGTEPYAICGHSLGAAEALLIGCLLIDDGLPPIKIGAFAPPRVGGDDFTNVARRYSSAYRYGDDPVPLAPFWTPKFQYKQVPLQEIGHFLFNVFSAHHIDCYVNAVPK